MTFYKKKKTEESNDDKCLRRVLSDIDILFRNIFYFFFMHINDGFSSKKISNEHSNSSRLTELLYNWYGLNLNLISKYIVKIFSH